MKHVLFYSILLLVLVAGCTKNEEAFDKKLKIDFSYNNLSGTYVNRDPSTTFSVESGKFVSANISIGGEEGFGSDKLIDVVQSLEVTTVTPRGTTTCIAIPRSMLANGTSWAIPIRETITLTYTLTSVSGETSVQGPFVITAVNNQLVYSDVAECLDNSFFVMSFGNLAAPHTYYGQFSYDNDVPLEVKYPILGGKTIGASKFLVIPSKFDQYGIAPNIVSKYTCGWNATKIMPYTGSMNLSEDVLLNTYTYADLNALSVTTSQDTLEVVPGALFVFETPEGKKGLGKFRMTQSATNISFVFQCQK